MWDYRDFKAISGIKIQGRHLDRPHEGAMRDRTTSCKMMSESQNSKIYKQHVYFC